MKIDFNHGAYFGDVHVTTLRTLNHLPAVAITTYKSNGSTYAAHATI